MKKDFKTLRVLVCDDEPLITMSISRFLKEKALVKTVPTAEEALDAIEEQHYDLCFLDIMLPGMSGLDAMKIINELSPTTKVAIMTGNLLDEAMKMHIEDTAYTFIEKPFSLSHIRGITDKVAVELVEQGQL
jgi:DNA-binding NtrC family response regulator